VIISVGRTAVLTLDAFDLDEGAFVPVEQTLVFVDWAFAPAEEANISSEGALVLAA